MSKVYEKIKNRLMLDIESGRQSHAYLFEGDASSLKMDLAEDIARRLLATEHLENCSDYFVLQKSAMNIESIRKITADCYIEPFKDWKVYLIEDAMEMTIPMQNAFLKTLEEPPSYVVFILLCENKAPLLATILSRCIHYYIPPNLKTSKQTTVSEEELVIKVNEFYEALSMADAISLMKVIDSIKASKDMAKEILNPLLKEAGNLLLEREILPETDEENPQENLKGKSFLASSLLKENIWENCKRNRTVFELLRFIDIIEDTRRKIGSRCTLNLSLEVMLFDILEVMQ